MNNILKTQLLIKVGGHQLLCALLHKTCFITYNTQILKVVPIEFIVAPSCFFYPAPPFLLWIFLPIPVFHRGIPR